MKEAPDMCPDNYTTKSKKGESLTWEDSKIIEGENFLPFFKRGETTEL